jgi:hypothetical protein
MLPTLESRPVAQPTTEMIENQLALLVKHPSLCSSRRLVSLLQFVVRQTLNGTADQLKERTIGVEVFGREPDYDTSNDHIVRTAASDLRKRLAAYYGDPAHLSQTRIDIPSGGYVPQFRLVSAERVTEETHPDGISSVSTEVTLTQNPRKLSTTRKWVRAALFVVVAGIIAVSGALVSRNRESPRTLFWKPVLQETGPLLFVIGDERQAPPPPVLDGGADRLPPSKDVEREFPSATIADAAAMTRIASVLAAEGKAPTVRGDPDTSFSDLQNGPAVLIGLFDNEWSLRLTRPLRFSLASDPDRHLLYIHDRQNPADRSWSVLATGLFTSEDPSSRKRPTADFALISRIENSQTGKVVVIAGGLYIFGTEAAGKFLTDPQLENLTAAIPMSHHGRDLQIVLRTDVIDGIPGPPKIVAYSEE